MGANKAIQKWMSKTAARQFALHGSEDKRFDNAWQVFWRFASGKQRKEREKEAGAEVGAAMGRVARTIRRFEAGQEGTDSAATGHAVLQSRSLAQGPYVIFSDHHITRGGHRQDLFVRHNLNLYADVLTEYHARSYTLVENGDVLAEPAVLELLEREDRAFSPHLRALVQAIQDLALAPDQEPRVAAR